MQCKKDPECKRAVFWAFLMTFKLECILIFATKLVLYIPDLADPFLVKRFTELIEHDQNSATDLRYGLMIATILVVKRFVT